MLTSSFKSTLKAHNPFRFDKEVISGLFTYCGRRNMSKIDGKARLNVEIKYFFEFHFKNFKKLRYSKGHEYKSVRVQHA